VTEAIDKYEFGEAAQQLYKFVWADFCDWYIELSKRRMSDRGEADDGDRARCGPEADAPLHAVRDEEIWQKLAASSR